MQETLVVPDPDSDGDTVERTYVFCTKCNGDHETDNSWQLPADWAEEVGVPAGAVVLRGVREGTAEEALADGWQEREWGHICPICLLQEPADIDEEPEMMAEADALSLLEGTEFEPEPEPIPLGKR
jgi:hypothetical protein